MTVRKLPAQYSSGDHRVKQIAEFKSIIPFEADQIIFAGVENFFNLGLAKTAPKRDIIQCQRVNQVIIIQG